MRKITFDEEELFAIAVFEPGSRKETTAKMSGVLEELTEDPDMHALIVSASEKLKRISDKEFEELDIDGYREELAWEETAEYEEDPESATDSENPGEPVVQVVKQDGHSEAKQHFNRGGNQTIHQRYFKRIPEICRREHIHPVFQPHKFVRRKLKGIVRKRVPDRHHERHHDANGNDQ